MVVSSKIVYVLLISAYTFMFVACGPDSCTKDIYWNDDALNTASLYLTVDPSNNFLLHTSINKGSGYVVPIPIFNNNATANVDRVFLFYQPDGEWNISITYFDLDSKIKVLHGTWKRGFVSAPIFRPSKTDEIEISFLPDGASFHKRIRYDGKTYVKFYDRENCATLKPVSKQPYNFCKKYCQSDMKSDCVYDRTSLNHFAISYVDDTEFDHYFIAQGCNIYLQGKMDPATNTSKLLVWKYSEKIMFGRLINLDLQDASCYMVPGYQFQIISKKWALGDCDYGNLPIEAYPPSREVSEHDIAFVEKDSGLMIYILIASIVVIVLVLLAGLYVFFCSDDEVDECIPPPGALPPPMTPGFGPPLTSDAPTKNVNAIKE